MIKKIAEKYGDQMYIVFRVFVGLMFFQHGAQKLFGWFGGQSAGLFTLMGLAGIVETFGGILIAIGLLTRWAAAVSAIQMLAAYFMMHFPKAWTPIANKGELALLYFAAFLVLMKEGAGKWGIDSRKAK
ncbi:MAG: DoxX family protein [Nanoarchaeota archaeon]